MKLDAYARLLLGRERNTSLRHLGGAVAAGALVFAAFLGWSLSGTPGAFPLTGAALYLVLLGLGAGVAGSHAYRNQGLVISVGIAAAIWLGYYLSIVLLELASPRPTVVTAFGQSLLYGVPIGITGYLLGRAIYHLEQRFDLPLGVRR